MEHVSPMLIADIQWPCSLSQASKERLLAIAQSYDYKQLTGPMPGILYVASGCLVGYTTNEKMESSLGMIFGHGCWFGIQGIGNPSYEPSGWYETLLPTELILFPKQELEQLLTQDPELYKLLFVISQHIGRMLLQLGSNTLFCLTTRVTYLLLELANHQPPKESSPPVISITQQVLSQIAGISRPRVNEALKVLADAGEIALGRGEIRLLAITELKARLPSFSYMYHDPIPSIAPIG